MWELENSIQLVSFMVCLGFGAGYCVLYDILRALRKNKEFSNLAISVQDVFYFLIIGLVTFLLLLKYTYGETRLYIFIAIFIGFFAFRFSLSRFFMKIFVKIFEVIFKVDSTVFCGFLRAKNKIHSFLAEYVEKIVKYCKNRVKNLKNILKRKH